MPRCTFVTLLASLVVLAAPAALRADHAAEQGFVRVRGRELLLDDRPFRFMGANVSLMHGERERAGYEAVLDAVKADGLRVVRVWALGEQPEPAQSYHPFYAFRIGEHGWIESSFVHLDRVLTAARARDLKVIVVLANRWKDYGGIATYLRWGGAEVARDERGEPAGSSLTAFFACARCQELYREHLERVVTRRNTLTGQLYRDDPTIMAWELINEASAVSAREEELLLDWVRAHAQRLRALDGRHLISAGHIGYQTERERRVWRAVQLLPEIDFADAHLYPETDPRVGDMRQLPALLDDPIALAALDVGKPLVFGEFGFDRDEAGARARLTRSFAQHVQARGSAGALIWIYEAPGSPARRHTIDVGASNREALRVRAALREAAASLETEPTLGALPWQSPNLPRFMPLVEERGSPAAHARFARAGDTYTLEIAPADFARAQFERAGVHAARGVETVWGAGAGELSYYFRAPAFVPHSLAIEARISSELPGAGDGSDARDGSDVELSIDDQLVGTVRAMPDDGRGQVVRVELVDARLLGRLFRKARKHTLRLRALASPYAGGLCVYGRERGTEPTAEAPGSAREQKPEAAAELAHVRITLERGPRTNPAHAAPEAAETSAARSPTGSARPDWPSAPNRRAVR